VSPTVARQAVSRPETLDELFTRLGSRARAFGGLYIEHGEVVIKLKDMEDASEVMAVLQDEAMAGGLRIGTRVLTQMPVRFEPATFGFVDLVEIYHQLEASGALRGVTFTDIDEKRNAVHLGVADEATATRVRERLSWLGITPAAVYVDVELAEPIVSLRDRIRPIRGAVQIERETGDLCSVGVNAETMLGAGFVTASHCSVYPFSGPDLGDIYQNTASAGNLVGREEADPAALPQWSAGCDYPEAADGCRISDASFIAYYGGVTGSQGLIARTVGIGSITIDNNHPNFLIGDARYRPHYLGEELHRLGRSTGWRQGEVTATCVHHHLWVDSLSLLCQTHADAIADFGDSGGPAFAWDGFDAYVELLGLTVGRLVVGNEIVGSVISQWMYVEFEVGGEVGGLDVLYY
jgi:hypothetical protein